MQRKRFFIVVFVLSTLYLMWVGPISSFVWPSAVPAFSGPLDIGAMAIGALILLHAAWRVGRPFPLILIAAVLWLASDLMVRYANAQAAYFTAIAVFSVVLDGAAFVCMTAATIVWFKDALERYK